MWSLLVNDVWRSLLVSDVWMSLWVSDVCRSLLVSDVGGGGGSLLVEVIAGE